MDLKTINISELDDSFQIRESTNEDTILKYCEQMKGYDGYGSFPPLRVVDVGGTLKIADGIHRYRAAKLAGLEEVPCEVIPGDEDTLFELSTRENLYHGLQMTRAEQKKVREKVIIHFWPKRHHTPEMLAKMLGVNRTTISRQIEELEKKNLIPHVDSVIGPDGKEYPTRLEKKSGCANAHPEPAANPGTPLKPAPVQTVPEGYVRCAVCGEVYPESLEEAADSVCEKVYDHETGKYVHLCGEECRLKYQTVPEPETPWEAEPEPEPEQEETPHSTLPTPHYVNDELDDDYEPGGEYVPTEEEEPEEEVYTEVDVKPERTPSVILEVGFQCEVKDCETMEDALKVADEVLKDSTSGTRVKISANSCIYNININNNIHDNINLNTPKFREEKTNYKFKLSGNHWFWLGVEKLNEFKNRYPSLNVESVIQDCMNWNNDGSGNSLVPFNKLYQRINTFLMLRRDQIDKQNGNQKKSKYGIDESALTSWEGY